MNGFKNIGSATASLNGANVIQVCFGRHEVILCFDNNASITILVEVALASLSYQPQHHMKIASELVALLGRKLVGTTVVDERTLDLSFEEQEGLRVIDDSVEYESFNLEVEGKFFVA